MRKKYKILWVDDEIEMLRAHILFLKEKGYDVSTVTNGKDAISEVRNRDYDLIFLDEMMTGMGGLETLSVIKEINPNIPVVMVTKNEEEALMNDAIGSKITDYLIKSVVPSQILMVCKKILDGKQISGEYVTKNYLQDFNSISSQLMGEVDFEDWIDINNKIVNWYMELDNHRDIELKQTLNEQKREYNKEFSKYVETNYLSWIENKDEENRPLLTTDIVEKFVIPHLDTADGPVFLFVLDCLRLDQWAIIEKHLIDFFSLEKDYYYSILPTATPYARNSLFSGLFPSEIENYYPDLWTGDNDDERSRNKYEKELLQYLLDRKKIKLDNELKYMKIIDPDVGRAFEQNIVSHKRTHFMAVVVNFLDMLVHGRSDSELIKEIAPDEAAFRSLTNSWFTHSSLFGTFRKIANMKNAKVIVTTDHGSIITRRAAKVLADRKTSKNLRFKHGRNLQVDSKFAMKINDFAKYKLPNRGVTSSYIIAKEDYYFIYPTDYHKYLNYYKDTFQHGGISMEEMILPVITMESRA
ncbi:MAG: response regulator [Ignavibacteriae bacterium]|nr:MAG: response regulator [Ignavibacteriota bacterium]